MSTNKTSTDTPLEFPEPLRSGEEFSDWRVCLRKDALELVTDFSHQFRVSQEEAVLALLSDIAHALGESTQVLLAHGRISPPFHWLAITPEREPIWTGSLLRYLRIGIDEHVNRQLSIIGNCSLGDVEEGKNAERAINPAKPIGSVADAAGLRVLRQIAATVTHDNPKPPFECPPIDRSVALLTPPCGILRSLANLSPSELLALEESLLGIHVTPTRSGAAVMAARPSFVWQLPQADISKFSRQHGAWFRDLPFAVTLGSMPSFPSIDGDVPVLRQFDKIAEVFFRERHARYANPYVQNINAETGKPVMRFLDEVGKWQTTSKAASSLRWVADLGIKFSLSLMRLEVQKTLDARLIEKGLELAKHFARRKFEILSATGWNHVTEIAEKTELTGEVRRAYLKICESDGMTEADLRRSSHNMSAKERDRIVAELLSRGLIRKEGKLLRQNAA